MPYDIYQNYERNYFNITLTHLNTKAFVVLLKLTYKPFKCLKKNMMFLKFY